MSIFTDITNTVLDRIMPEVTKRLDEVRDAGIEEVKKQIPVLMDKLLALLPLVAATVGKETAEQLISLFAKVLRIDPDVPVLSDVFDLSETVRQAIEGSDETPDGFKLPSIADVFNQFRPR